MFLKAVARLESHGCCGLGLCSACSQCVKIPGYEHTGSLHLWWCHPRSVIHIAHAVLQYVAVLSCLASHTARQSPIAVASICNDANHSDMLHAVDFLRQPVLRLPAPAITRCMHAPGISPLLLTMGIGQWTKRCAFALARYTALTAGTEILSQFSHLQLPVPRWELRQREVRLCPDVPVTP